MLTCFPRDQASTARASSSLSFSRLKDLLPPSFVWWTST